MQIPLITDLGPLPLSGALEGGTDLSALALQGDVLFVASDESNRVQVLRRAADGASWHVDPAAAIALPGGDKEIDLESLALDGSVLYAAGSHAATRPAMKPDKDYAQNRRSLDDIDRSPRRKAVFRINLGAGEAAIADAPADSGRAICRRGSRTASAPPAAPPADGNPKFRNRFHRFPSPCPAGSQETPCNLLIP
jgi:hypothetical protein